MAAERNAQNARRVEVRLLRRLPAQPARLRGRAARARRRARDRLLPRGDAARSVDGPVRPLARRGLDHDRRTTPSASRRSARASRALITIGACATAGGIQALRNFADVEEFTAARLRHAGLHLDARDLDADQRPRPRRLRAPRLPDQQAPAARGDQRLPQRAAARASAPHSVCVECKRRGTVCVMVAHGTPCLGPVTHAGCGALCPAYDRGCYGCFGPMETPNTGVARRAWRAGRRGRATSCASTARSTRRATPFREASERA